MGFRSGRAFRVIEKYNEQPAVVVHTRHRDLAVSAIPIGFQVHYATVLLTIYPEAGSWIIKLADPFGAGTVATVSGSVSAAKQQALVVAHGYLRNTYPDRSWPVIPDEQIRWKRMPK